MSYFGTSRFACRLPYSDITRVTKQTGSKPIIKSEGVQQDIGWNRTQSLVIQGAQQSAIISKIVSTYVETNSGTTSNIGDVGIVNAESVATSNYGVYGWYDIVQETGSTVVSSVPYAAFAYYWICTHEDIEPEDITKEVE